MAERIPNLAALARARGEADWLVARREAAAARLLTLPPPVFRYGLGNRLPTAGWRRPTLAKAPAAAATRLAPGDARVLVQDFSAALATPVGLDAWQTLTARPDRRCPNLAAWQEAWGGEEIFVSVPAGVTLAEPVQLTLGVRSAAARRVLVAVGSGSRLTIVSRLHLTGGLLAEQLDILAGPGAVVDLLLLESGRGQAFRQTRLVAAAEAHLNFHQFVAGRGFRQTLTDFYLEGPRSTAQYRTASLGGGLREDESCHVSLHALDTHAEVRAEAVVGHDDKIVSRGRLVLHQAARGATGHERSEALLLEEGGEFVAQPDLAAENDLVQCGHEGAAAGPSTDQLFYLMARGLDRARATRFLVESFLAPFQRGLTGSGLEKEVAAIIKRQMKNRSYAA